MLIASRTLSTLMLTSLLIATSAASSSAEQAQTLVFKVVGVSKGDTLNVRERISDPSNVTASRVVGTIPAGAEDVLATGTTQVYGRHRWYEVRHGNALGWVNGRFLRALDGKSPEVPDINLFCGGTEPFWSVRISASGATLSRPGMPEAVYKPKNNTAGATDDGGKSFAFETAGKPPLTLQVRPRQWCNDGMSDLEYAFEGTLTGLEGDTAPSRRGCCSLLR